jgi:UDP-GlcNAc:undecaprenyl-phosphate/decaprenyl-phosphate GlcNAc-1-phosphate transferase
MRTYLLLFVVSTTTSLGLTPIVRRLCQRWRWLDQISDKRHLHQAATPRLGGVAVYLSLIAGLLPLFFIDNLLTDSLREAKTHYLRLMLPATLTLLLGCIDDLRGLKALQKFSGLAAITVLFYVMGGRVEGLTVPFFGSVHLPMIVGLLVTVVWMVGIANAFNLIDGMDGLAAGAAIFSSLVIMAISMMQGRPLVAAIVIALTGSLIGFLRYNFNPASIFLGDSGALLIGFLLGALSIEGAQKASTAVAVAIPLMAFGLPVLDTGFTMVRRFISRKPIFAGDREHIHHKLLDLGWSQKKAALVLYGVCAAFGLLTLLFVESSERTIGVGLFIIGVTIVLAVSHLRYHELDELRASVKRHVGDRRIRGANNITIRRACRNLAKAQSLSELFEAVVEVLEIGEFTRAVIIVGEGCDPVVLEAALSREAQAPALSQAHMRDGLIWWHWTPVQTGSTGDVGDRTVWSLRIPLTAERVSLGHFNLYRSMGADDVLLDLNYLCTLFQEHLAQATLRLLVESAPQKARAMAARA